MRSVVARLLSIACLTYFSFVLLAQAQDVSSEQLKKFILSDTHKKMMTEAFSHLPPDVFQRCSTLVWNKHTNVEFSQVSFGSDGQPNAGAWKESWAVSGCGNDTTWHVHISVKNGKINIFVATPGETRGDITLQRDALTYAQMGANVAAKTCKTFIVKNTKFDGTNGKSRSWRETWTMIGCNRTFDVPLTFSPSARGGTDIRVNASAVVERH